MKQLKITPGNNIEYSMKTGKLEHSESEMKDVNVEEIISSLSGEELCKYCRYGIDYDCDGGIRSDGAGNPIYPPCADGLDEDYFDLEAYLVDMNEELKEE